LHRLCHRRARRSHSVLGCVCVVTLFLEYLKLKIGSRYV
jgi:hypothetical protein